MHTVAPAQPCDRSMILPLYSARIPPVSGLTPPLVRPAVPASAAAAIPAKTTAAVPSAAIKRRIVSIPVPPPLPRGGIGRLGRGIRHLGPVPLDPSVRIVVPRLCPLAVHRSGFVHFLRASPFQNGGTPAGQSLTAGTQF